MGLKMIGLFFVFLTFTNVYSNKKKNGAVRGGDEWDYPCPEDSIFGFISGGDSEVEAILGFAWGVGTSVASHTYPMATDFATNAMNFGNMIANWEETDCKTPFKQWMHDTFATKTEVKHWIDLKAQAIKKEVWTKDTDSMNLEIVQHENELKLYYRLFQVWLKDQKPGELHDHYTDALDELRDSLLLCAEKMFHNAQKINNFKAFDIAALAAGSRCAVDFYATLHLLYATARNDVELIKHDILKDRFIGYRDLIADWETKFDNAVRQIIDRRRDESLMYYEKFEGKCRSHTRDMFSCGGGQIRKPQTWTRTNRRETICVFHDNAFELDELNKKAGKIEKIGAGYAYIKECGRTDRCPDMAKQGCDNSNRKKKIIDKKMGVLLPKLASFRRKVFTIDFAKTTDVISQMINGLEYLKSGKTAVENSCALKKNHACGGSLWKDFSIFDSALCLQKCREWSRWDCKCITMSKSTGCRIESGLARRRPTKENKYWALNKADCRSTFYVLRERVFPTWAQKTPFKSGRCSRKSLHTCTDLGKRACGAIARCSYVAVARSQAHRNAYGYYLYTSDANRHIGTNNDWNLYRKSESETVESLGETAVGTEGDSEELKGEKVETAVANDKLKETNEALSAILRELENQ